VTKHDPAASTSPFTSIGIVLPLALWRTYFTYCASPLPYDRPSYKNVSSLRSFTSSCKRSASPGKSAFEMQKTTPHHWRAIEAYRDEYHDTTPDRWDYQGAPGAKEKALMLSLRLVIDTNVLVSAALNHEGLQRTTPVIAVTKPAHVHIRRGDRLRLLQLIKNSCHIVAPTPP
jgi:hypothetical protein